MKKTIMSVALLTAASWTAAYDGRLLSVESNDWTIIPSTGTFSQELSDYRAAARARVEKGETSLKAWREDVVKKAGITHEVAQEKLRTLEIRIEDQKRTLDGLTYASGEAWERMKAGALQAAKDLEDAYEDARRQFE